MELGSFSVSLSVKDLAKSKTFYQTLGFKVFHGDEAQGWLIMKNNSSTIGLFQGMFEGNILTFNPGWDQDAQAVKDFTDIREIQAHLTSNGIETETKIDVDSTGPANLTVKDPDGNVILLDQHV